MSRFYTDSKEMYFEVQESEASKYSRNENVFTVHAFYKNDENNYSYERQIPEDVFFQHEIDAEIVAQSLSWAYDWGVEITKEKYKDNVLEKIKNTLSEL